MSILEKIEKSYKNQIEIIKREKNRITKMKLIGSLALDIGGRCISAIAKTINCSRKFVRKSIAFVKCGCKEQLKLEFRGRKRITEKYCDLKEDIKTEIEDSLSTDPRFKSEKQYVNMTIEEIKNRLIKTGKYNDNSFSNSSLNNLVNQMGYHLKKVKKTKPLKKIEETDAIFENVHKKKQEALVDECTVLISLDTKDKVLLGPFSRGGKNRIQIEAVDHELTNDTCRARPRPKRCRSNGWIHKRGSGCCRGSNRKRSP